MFKTKSHISWLFILLLPLAGIAAVLFSTTLGAGLSPDSATYVQVARNFLNGHGLTLQSSTGEAVLFTYAPPLFPAILAAMEFFGITALSGIRWLNALLFGVNILLVGLVLRRYSCSFWLSMFGSLLILFSVDMLRVYTMVWTEPLFIFFAFSGLALLTVYSDNPRLLLLAASSCTIALAFFVRYAGVALIPTGIFAICFLSNQRWLRRIRDSIIFVCISCLPMGLWLIANACSTGTTQGVVRNMAFHPVTPEHILSGFDTASKWLLPRSDMPVIRKGLLSLLLISVSVLIVQMRKRTRKPDRYNSTKRHFAKFPHILATFIFFYGALVIVTLSFFDTHRVVIDFRLLSIVCVSAIVLVLCIVYKLLFCGEGFGTAIKTVSVVVVTTVTVSCLLHWVGWVRDFHNDSQGYAAKEWRNSETIRLVKALPSGIPIFTNGSDVVYILTDRMAWIIPRKVRASTKKDNANYLSELDEMKSQLENSNGVLVYFDRVNWRWYLPSEDELKEQLPLRLLTKGSDGSIYEIAK